MKLFYGVIYTTYIIYLVPMAGIEPARHSPLPPQDSVSTNSTTSAAIYSGITISSSTESVNKSFLPSSTNSFEFSSEIIKLFSDTLLLAK